jgi:hypothetical protein
LLHLEPNKERGRGGAETQRRGEEEVKAVLEKPEEAAQGSQETVHQQVQVRNGRGRTAQT